MKKNTFLSRKNKIIKFHHKGHVCKKSYPSFVCDFIFGIVSTRSQCTERPIKPTCFCMEEEQNWSAALFFFNAIHMLFDCTCTRLFLVLYFTYVPLRSCAISDFNLKFQYFVVFDLVFFIWRLFIMNEQTKACLCCF